MGQYYNAVILKKNRKTVESYVYSWDFDNGLKLMEHSWIENPFVKRFETLIHDNPKNVVWAGDYADHCKGCKTNVYDRCNEKLKVKPEYELSILDSIYIINHSKKEFVSKLNVPDNNGWRVHPLPLLTCEGNGRGGGDYRSDDFENKYIGSWARDLISVNGQKPTDEYTEIFPNFYEK